LFLCTDTNKNDTVRHFYTFDESLSTDDPIPSSLSGDLFLPAFPFLLSIIFLKQFSAVNISVFFSEPIAHFSLVSMDRQEEQGINVYNAQAHAYAPNETK
jgi:hypothetical protein